MLDAKRKLKDLLIDLIALVKSPASTFKFAVIKSAEGGDELVDEILQLVQDICAEEQFEGLEKTAIPEERLVAVKDALTVLKGVLGDLPDNAQAAIKELSRIAGYGYTVQEKSTDKKKEDDSQESVLAVLGEIQAQVANADKKFDAMATEAQTSKEAVGKSLSALVERLSTLEKTTGVAKAKAADDIQKVATDADKKEPDFWGEAVIPSRVML